MTTDKKYEDPAYNEKVNLNPTNESGVTSEIPSISKENLPSFSKIPLTMEKTNQIRY